MEPESAKIRWAPRLPPRLLERLYESDAKGLRDLDLCDDVGIRLYARCRTFVLVSESEVECPACRKIFSVSSDGVSRCPGGECSWSTTKPVYQESLRNHYAYPGRAGAAFSRFHRRYPSAKTYRDKILLIDELIHSFHIDEAKQLPVKSVASKLFEGNKVEVVRFLDRLSAIDPAGKTRWREAASGTLHERVLRPGDGEGEGDE